MSFRTEDLDQKLIEWCDRIEHGLDIDADKTPVGRGRIVVGEMASKVCNSKRPAFGDTKQGNALMLEALESFEEEISAVLRSNITMNAWPLGITFGLSEHGRVYVDSMSVFGVDLERHPCTEKSVYRGWKAKSLTGVNAVADQIDYLDLLTPPTNAPRAIWLSAHDLAGCEHVSATGIYAKSEIDFLMKKNWVRKGAEFLETVLENGLEIHNNDDRTWFVREELNELWTDPEGVRLSQVHFKQEHQDFLSRLREEFAKEGQDEDLKFKKG